MKVLVQRVSRASVSVNDRMVGKIGPGLVVFMGVAQGDSKEDAVYLANKVANLRIFADGSSHFSLSALDTRGDILIVSQFTLLGDTRKGRRPDFTAAAPPDLAKELYASFVDQVRATGLKVETGVFQEHMVVEIHNDGPVTVSLESKSK
jgi:D-tyrosyl-tRNA(Tyr) deacylase